MVALKFLDYNIVLEIRFYISAVHMHIFFVLKQGLRKYTGHVVEAHTFNPRIQEAEAGRSLGSRPAWST